MRYVVRVLVLMVVGVIASLVGVLVALTVTPPGRALLARNVSHQLETLLRDRCSSAPSRAPSCATWC